jgi:pimeloyl-ACP methyl ester carboxylesterase
MPIKNVLFVALAAALWLFLRQIGKRELISPKWLRRSVSVAGKTAALGLLVWAVVFVNLSPVASTGPYAVASQVIQLDDPSRTETFSQAGGPRKLAVLMVFPEAPQLPGRTLPLVLFSHGGISSMQGNLSLFEGLASHGYVVASVSHSFHALSTPIDGRNRIISRGYFADITRENSHKDIGNSLRLFDQWMALRIADLSFVLDQLLAPGGDAPWRQMIDAGSIGLGGHSLGGAAAYGLARKRQDVRAVMALESPYLADITGISGGDFTWDTAPYHCAMLNLYSDTGMRLVDKDHKYAQNKRLQAPGMGAESLHLSGSNHFTLTDLALTSPILCTLLDGSHETPGIETLRQINQAALSFYNAHLKGPGRSN